jgi:hypothetical protein
MNRSFYRLLGLTLLCPLLAFGQKDTASIIGTVTDNTGATVPGAAIDAMSLETNFTYHARRESGPSVRCASEPTA